MVRVHIIPPELLYPCSSIFGELLRFGSRSFSDPTLWDISGSPQVRMSITRRPTVALLLRGFHITVSGLG